MTNKNRATRGKAPDAEQRFQRALDAGVPQIYVNGFMNGLGTGDVHSVLERNGQPVAVLNMSFTVAKTFAQALAIVVSEVETRAGREMLTTHDVERIFLEEPKEAPK